MVLRKSRADGWVSVASSLQLLPCRILFGLLCIPATLPASGLIVSVYRLVNIRYAGG